MADNKLLLIGGAAAAAWWFFFRTPSPATTPVVAVPAPAAPVVVDPNKVVGANTIDGIYARMTAAAKTSSAGVDEWNYVLGQAWGQSPPDPMPIFTAAIPGFDRSQKLTAGQYWAVMAPWLKANAGLSGLGPRGLGWMYEVAV